MQLRIALNFGGCLNFGSPLCFHPDGNRNAVYLWMSEKCFGSIDPNRASKASAAGLSMGRVVKSKSFTYGATGLPPD
jgi:hypothetical protein